MRTDDSHVYIYIWSILLYMQDVSDSHYEDIRQLEKVSKKEIDMLHQCVTELFEVCETS